VLLKDLEFTDSEAKVYLALVELGRASKGRIVESAGIASSKVYELLDKLTQKGLAGYVIKSGVKFFHAAPPERLLDYLRAKEEKLAAQRAKLEEIIPVLDRKLKAAAPETTVELFEGLAGAATSFGDILRELSRGDEYYVLGISKFTPEFERFVVRFHRRRAKAGIRCRIIVNELARSTGEQLAAVPLTQVRYVDKEIFTPVVFIVYRHKTLISLGLDEVFIQVSSKNLADGMRAYAQYMWKAARP